MSYTKKTLLVSFVSGLLFAVGLALSGMTQPAKVVAFLDFTGDWDPSLAFVMGGAILVYAPLFRWAQRCGSPRLAREFLLPTRNDIDKRLVIGSSLFGIGWGLGGFCPGPGITSLGSGGSAAVLFVGSMLAGMFVFRLFELWRDRVRSRAAAAEAVRT